MGIRIHKALGYGGIFPNIPQIFEYLDEHGVNGEVNKLIVEAIPTSFDRYLFLETEDMATKIGRPYPKQFYECIKHTEYEIDEKGYTLIIPPIHIKDWQRYDDAIDYYCDSNSEDMETSIKILEKPIYPYTDWMDPVTFERIDAEESFFRKICETKPKPIPGIPDSVRLIADKVGLDWKVLKPIVATWWS